MALEDGFEPTTRTPSTCRSTSELLQRVDPTPGIEPGRGGSADRRLPIWPGRVVWHQGKDLNPHSVVQSHVSYRLDHPGVLVCAALDGDRTRLELLDRQSSPPEDREGVKEKVRGGGAPGRIRTSTATRYRVTARWARLCPSRRAFHHALFLACHAYSVFNVRVPDHLGKKKRGLASPGPLLTPLFRGGSSIHSHGGDSGPGDARVDSCPRTDALAGIGVGRRRQPTSRLRRSIPLFCLWHS